jgi:hypothetical protein
LFGEHFLVKGYTRETLRDGIQELLLYRVTKEVGKILNTTDLNTLKATDLYKKISAMQGSMGAFGSSERYLRVKTKAIEQVLKDTSIPWAKRAILKRALYRQQTEGNFWAFMHPDTQPQPA